MVMEKAKGSSESSEEKEYAVIKCRDCIDVETLKEQFKERVVFVDWARNAVAVQCQGWHDGLSFEERCKRLRDALRQFKEDIEQ